MTKFILNILEKITTLFLAFKLGEEKQTNKELKKEIKENGKLRKIEDKTARLSRADKLKRLFND